MPDSDRLRAGMQRMTDLANRLSAGTPNAHELLRELFNAFADVLREEHGKPQPIDSAPKDLHRKLLLYCPRQGGWRVGEWSGERWISTWNAVFLQPTHWADVPPEPDE